MKLSKNLEEEGELWPFQVVKISMGLNSEICISYDGEGKGYLSDQYL